MRTRTRNIFRSGGLLLVAVMLLASALGGGAATAAPARSLTRAPQAALPATPCTGSGTVTCELWATNGTISLPGTPSVPIWGYSTSSTAGTATLPGPVLIVNQNDTVNVILHNNLPAAAGNTSLSFPGQSLAPDMTGIPNLPPTKTYTFVAGNPGTYSYEAGLTADGPRQAAMGLFGALVVRPTGCATCAYGAGTPFDDEALVVISEIDPAFNAAPATFNLRNYAPKYWLINGKAYPDTDTPSPMITTSPGRRLLLRYLNAGLEHHLMGLAGIHQTVLANDGQPYPFTYQVVAETIPAGASLDTLVTIPPAVPLGTRYALYEAGNHLDNSGARTGGTINFGGMLTFVTILSGGPPTNQAPSVNADPDQTITLPASATLDGTVTDDGLPGPAVTTTWTKQSGPGTVSFGNASAVDTTASFSTAGTYVLRLTANDSALSAFDEATITVNPAPVDLIFQEGFESGNFAAWTSAVNSPSRITVTSGAAQAGTFKMQALISGGTSGYVVDGSPANETSYHARFYINPNGAAVGSDRDIFVGLNASNTVIFRVQLRLNGGQYQIRTQITRSGGTTTTSRYNISNTYHAIEISWQSGASTSSSLYIDGTLRQTLAGLNTSAYTLDSVRLGLPASGLGGGASGTVFFDNFKSTHTTLIGP